MLGIDPRGPPAFLCLLAQVLELVQLPIPVSADDHIQRVLLPWNNPQKLANIRPFRKFTDAWKAYRTDPVQVRSRTMSIAPEIQPKPPTLIGGRKFDWGSKTFVMGIINVTPDSFSGDGVLSGDGPDIDLVLRTAKKFEKWGCDIIDVGGESTRPAFTYAEATPTSETEELRRVIPAIEAIASAVQLPVSVDTYKASVAHAAIEAGASLVNDVWGFTRDPEIASVVAETGVPVVLMHNQTHTRYRDVVPDVIARLAELREGAIAEGIGADRIILDPGIGFGKTPAHNLKLLRHLEELQSLDAPILIGTSRKSTIGQVLDLPPDDRIEGTAATVALSIAGGADIVRVHDVREMVRVARMADAVIRGWEPAKPVSDD